MTVEENIETVTERIPRADVAQMVELAKLRGARIIGPNCLGVLSPDEAKMGGLGGPAVNVRRAPDAAIATRDVEQAREIRQLADRAHDLLAGEVGLVARAIAFALIGLFTLKAARDYNPKDAVGIDGAPIFSAQQPLCDVVRDLITAHAPGELARVLLRRALDQHALHAANHGLADALRL